MLGDIAFTFSSSRNGLSLRSKIPWWKKGFDMELGLIRKIDIDN